MVRVKVDVHKLFATVGDGPVQASDHTKKTEDLVTEQGHAHCQYCLASCSVSYEMTEQNQIEQVITQLLLFLGNHSHHFWICT